MSIIEYSNSFKCAQTLNKHNQTIKKDLVSVPKNVANFSFVDKWPFDPTRRLKFLKSCIDVLVGPKSAFRNDLIQQWFDQIRKVKILWLKKLHDFIV